MDPPKKRAEKGAQERFVLIRQNGVGIAHKKTWDKNREMDPVPLHDGSGMESCYPPGALAPPGRDARATFRPRWSPRAGPPVDGRVRQGRKRTPVCADALLATARGKKLEACALEPGIRPDCQIASGSQRRMLEGGFGDNPAAGSRNFRAHSGLLRRPFKPRTACLRRPDRARSRSMEHPSTRGTPRVGAPQKNFSPAAFGVGPRPERDCLRPSRCSSGARSPVGGVPGQPLHKAS